MKRLLSLLVSAAILAVLWMTVDVGSLFARLAEVEAGRLALAVALLLVLIPLSALRLIWLGRLSGFELSVSVATRATFAANALNMVLPGKAGDLLKSVILAKDRPGSMDFALSLSIWEKVADLAALFVLAAVSLLVVGHMEGAAGIGLGALGLSGLLVVPGLAPFVKRIKTALIGARIGFADRLLDRWAALQKTLAARPGSLAGLLGFTLSIWGLHAVQMCLLLWAIGVEGAAAFWLGVVGVLPLIILAGLVPLTFAGVGTRDAAITLLLGGTVGAATAAGFGVLFWLRYLVPGLVGLIFLPEFFGAVTKLRKDRAPASD